MDYRSQKWMEPTLIRNRSPPSPSPTGGTSGSFSASGRKTGGDTCISSARPEWAKVRSLPIWRSPISNKATGIGVIDPHGDLVQTLLSHIPQERIKDVIYFNPGDIEYPIAFNPLSKVSPDVRHLVVSGLISVFKKIWFEFWGPRLEHILRHALTHPARLSECNIA